MNWLKVILAVLAIFGTGIVSGKLIEQRAVVPAIPPRTPKSLPMPPPTITMASVVWLDHHLKLTADQKAEIADLLSQSRERIKPYAEPLWTKLREESTTVSNLVRNILTGDQIQKFEKLPRMRPDWESGKPNLGRRLSGTNQFKGSDRPSNRFDRPFPTKEGGDTNRLRRPFSGEQKNPSKDGGNRPAPDTQETPARP